MKKIFLFLGISITFLGVNIKTFAQDNDIYFTPKQNKALQAELKKKDLAQAKEFAKMEEEYKKHLQKEVYYYDPIDENGFTQFEIDEYNHRHKSDTTSLKQLKGRRNGEVFQRAKMKSKNKYTDRIRRFHRDDAVVVIEDDEVYILSDDYYNEDTPINIYIYGNSDPWYDYGCYAYPWYDPFYSPWYYSSWYPRYYYYSRPYHWNWYWNSWGWNYSGSWSYSPWYNGYNWGYHDGFWDGYYWGSSHYGNSYYDPYNGSSYKRYSNGRRSSELYGGQYNQRRQSSNSYGRNISTNSLASRNSYSRGDYWTNSQSRITDNTASNNYGYGRNSYNNSNERGTYQRSEGEKINSNRNSYSKDQTSRGVYRQPKMGREYPSSNSRQISSERYTPSRSRNSYSRDYGNYRSSYSRRNSSTSSSYRSSNTYRPSRNYDYDRSSSSRSSNSYTPSRNSSSSSSNGSSSRGSYGGGSSRNSTSRR